MGWLYPDADVRRFSDDPTNPKSELRTRMQTLDFTVHVSELETDAPSWD